MKTLVFFTSSFPYGKGEAFIESEFPYLYKTFERIIIVTNDLNSKTKRPIPEDVIIIRYPYSSSSKYKYISVFPLFTGLFLSELKFVYKILKLRLNKNILFTILGSISKSIETRELIIDKIINKYNLEISDTWFYAYWMNDMAIGLASFKKKFPGAKVFCRAHRGDLYLYTNSDNFLPLRFFLLSQLDRCYVISENGKQYMTQLLGEENVSNVVVSRLGTNNEYTRPPQVTKKEFTMVSCSTITIAKRVEFIAYAVAELQNVNLKWLHFGDGILRAKVENISSKLLLYKKGVEHAFMSNYRNPDLLRFYSQNQVDLFINVSSSEGIPVSIMEAMSFGIPVIATNTGGTGEIVKNGYNGYLIDVNSSPEQIARVISHYMALSMQEKRTLSENAYKTWDENFNASKNYTRFVSELLKL